MAAINRTALFGKLNMLGRTSVEAATAFCKMRGNPYVELVHWFHQILQLPNSDLHAIITHFDLVPARLARDVTARLDRLSGRASEIKDMSPELIMAVQQGWMYATLLYRDWQIRTGHLMVAILDTPELQKSLYQISREFKKIAARTLIDHFDDVVAGSPEEEMHAVESGPPPPQTWSARMQTGQTCRQALFGKLNELAYETVGSATAFCKMRGNPYVELVHWIHQILQQPGCDLHCVIEYFELIPRHLTRDVTVCLDKLPQGATEIRDISSHLELATLNAWIYATLRFNELQVRTGYLLIAMLSTPPLPTTLYDISSEFQKVDREVLAERFDEIMADSPENGLGSVDAG